MSHSSRQFDYINQYYGLKIKYGTRVKIVGKEGVVVSARPGHYIRVRFDGDKYIRGPFHPTSHVEYLD